MKSPSLVAVLIGFCTPASGEDIRLHQQIDEFIEASASQPIASTVDDAGFLRRVTLDFAGTIPGADEVRSFIADETTDKREAAIDRLFDDTETWARRMANVFHIHLMERRGDHDLWTQWLEDGFARNRPWDEMVRELIRADFREESTRGAAWFYTNRLTKTGQNPTDFSGLTRDVGRLFLGMDLQCAECHNHLLIKDYDQVDFQGLYLAFQNLKLQRTEYPAVEEQLVKEPLTYASVFTGVQREVGPRVPGREEFVIPTFETDEERWAIMPDKKAGIPGVPGFSPLAVLASEIPEGATFDANIVNRLWFLMMGRGLVEPLDQIHSANPASHPALLDLLVEEFRAQGGDIRWLLKELAMTRAYQRSSEIPAGVSQVDDMQFTVGIERRLSAEQLLASVARATGNLEKDLPLENVEPEEDDGEEFVGLRERFLDALGNDRTIPEREFAPSLKSALFLLNDPEVQKMFGDQLANLTPEELVLQVLSRPATAEEITDIKAFPGDNRAVAWALISSTEFLTNH